MAMTTGAKVPPISPEILSAAMDSYIKAKGRPTKFTPALAVEICDRIAKGETLKRICEDKHIPDYATICTWRGKLPDFGEMFTRARLMAADSHADDAIDILDSTSSAKTLTEIRSAEIRAKGRLELAKVRDRDTYGDKQQINQTVNVTHTVGGIIELISGSTAPLVCLGEVEEAQLIG